MSPFASRDHTPEVLEPDSDQPWKQQSRDPRTIAFSPTKRKIGGSLKGKERLIEDGTFPGVITYRHILGNNNIGPSSPLRVIAHIDIDAAYAAMEMARLGIDPDVPLAVQQWQGLIAVNYPARKFGITRHETPKEAVKKCPGLVMVHCATYRNGDTEPGYWDGADPSTHKISLDHYRRESLKILKVFGEHCPIVEKASIDESYLDATAPVRKILLERYPQLGTLPAGADLDTPLPTPKELGVRVDWPSLGNLVPVNGQKNTGSGYKFHGLLMDDGSVITKEQANKLAEELGVDPAADVNEGESNEISPEALSAALEKVSQEMKSSQPAAEMRSTTPTNEPSEQTSVELAEEEADLTWSDVCLAIGAEIVATCRHSVHTELGYTCSAGIAPNKMLAKLCSAWKKPNAQTVLRFSAIAAFLKPLPFQKIRNLGGKLGAAVKEVYDAETVGDLLDHSLADMQKKLGEESGAWLWEAMRGLDYTEVEAKTHFKSILSSKNFRPSISKYSEVTHWLHILATELHLRLLEAREISPGLWPKTIVLHVRSPSYVIRSHQIPFAFTSRFEIPYIIRHADRLLRVAVGDKLDKITPQSKIGPFSNLQLSFSSLERLEEGQKGIEKFFGAGAAIPAKRERESTPTESRDPKGTTQRAKGEVESMRAFDQTPVILDSDEPEIAQISAEPEPRKKLVTPKLPTATCPRCDKVLMIPSHAFGALKSAGFDSQAIESALQKERDEHADFHFARDFLTQEREKDRAEYTKQHKQQQQHVKQERESPAETSVKMKRKASDEVKGKKEMVKREKKGQTSLKNFFG